MPATAASRYALSEIVLIRATSVFEAALANFAYKLTCGALFPDGSADVILMPARSLDSARVSMQLEGGARTVPKSYLKWTKVKFIGESIKGVLDPSCHYYETCQRFGSSIAEIFEIRNHAAHKNKSSRAGYQKWVKQQYGQERNIQLGYFLLSTNFVSVPNIVRYITTIKIIVDDIAKGP
jgi:hypothetical protein